MRKRRRRVRNSHSPSSHSQKKKGRVERGISQDEFIGEEGRKEGCYTFRPSFLPCVLLYCKIALIMGKQMKKCLQKTRSHLLPEDLQGALEDADELLLPLLLLLFFPSGGRPPRLGPRGGPTRGPPPPPLEDGAAPQRPPRHLLLSICENGFSAT